MDPFEELERLASNASISGFLSDNEPNHSTIERWQVLFHYTPTQARDLILDMRNDLGRNHISDQHWNLIKGDKEAEGHDRESFEHELFLMKNKCGNSKSTTGTIPVPNAREVKVMYLIRLEAPLSTAAEIREAGQLVNEPEILENDEKTARFCRITGMEKYKIAVYLARKGANLKPTFTRLIQNASKDLSATSIYPTLGKDATLPQYRLDANAEVARPSQNEYPVWYFFYGTLADPEVLTRQLSLRDDERLVLKAASITGGVIKTWGGKYRALVDGPEWSTLDGSAFLVLSKEHEDALRHYETDNYEVVRCDIVIEGRRREKGCTFRFVGTVD